MSEFNPDYQHTEDFQKMQHSWSKWKLMVRYLDNKILYYKGSAELTDQEFDSLESSIKALHGEKTLQEWGCVGVPTKNLYMAVSRLFKFFDEMIIKKYINPSNEYARKVNAEMFKEKVEVIKEKVIEKVEIILETFDQSEDGQFTMGF